MARWPTDRPTSRLLVHRSSTMLPTAISSTSGSFAPQTDRTSVEGSCPKRSMTCAPASSALPGLARRRRPGGSHPTTSRPRSRVLGAMLLSRDAIAAADGDLPCGGLLQDLPRVHLRRDHLAVQPRGARRLGDRHRGAAPTRAPRSDRRPVGVRLPAGQHPLDRQRRVLRARSSRSWLSCAGWCRSPARSASSATASPRTSPQVLDRAESLVFDVAQRRVVDSMAPLRDLLGQSLDHLEQLFGRDETVTGLATGYADLDEMLAGLQPSNLVVVGARPSMGKTSFALGVVAHVGVRLHQPVLFFSMEMSHLEITQRLLVRGGAGRRDADAHRTAARHRLAEDRQRDRPDERRAHLHRRQPAADRDGHPRPRPTPEEPRGPRSGRRRLPPADDRAPRRGEPTGRGVRDQPRPQDPRP